MIEPQDTLHPYKGDSLHVGDELTSPGGARWSLIKRHSQVNGVEYWSACCEALGSDAEAETDMFSADDPFALGSPTETTQEDRTEGGEYEGEGVVPTLAVGLTVELKIVWPRAYSDDPTMWRFQAELEIERLASVEHQGVQRVYAWGVDESYSCWWIAFEEVKGVSLARIIKTQHLPTRDARQFFLTLARGLEACHKAQVSHRHLDPAYIILSETHAKITRFQLPEEVRAGEIAAATALLKSPELPDSLQDENADPLSVSQLRELPRYDLLPPEWLDGVDGESSADLYSFGACLLRALNPDGVTWRDAPSELQAVIAVTMHLDPTARGDAAELCRLLEQAAMSYLYQGTEDDTARRLMSHEVVQLIRADEVAWHMLGYPKHTPDLTPNMSEEDHGVELMAWGGFQEVVDAIERAKRAQPTGERDRSTQKALELLRREEDLNQRERDLRRELKRHQLKLKAQSEELEQLKAEMTERDRVSREALESERARALNTRAEADELNSRAREEYEIAQEARAFAQKTQAEREEEQSLTQAELKSRHETLRTRAIQLKTLEEDAASKQSVLEGQEERLNTRQDELIERQSRLEVALAEARRTSARAKVDATEAAELKERALQSEEAARAARQRAEIEREEHLATRQAERAEWRARREELEARHEEARRDSERARSERVSAERERSISKEMLSEAERAAQRVLTERAAVDADLEEVKREREHLKRERSKLLEGQRDLIDQTRRLTFRERSVEQRSEALRLEEERIETERIGLEQRLTVLTTSEERVERGKHALLSERRELESDRKELERARAGFSGSFLALTQGRVARGEDGEPLPPGHLNTVEVEGVTLRLRYCPPGRALHGSKTSETHLEEQPRHLVEMTRGYWLSESPVTQRLWRAVMGPKEWRIEGDQLPADQLTWLESLDFCNQLSRAFGLSPAYKISWSARPTAQWLEDATGYRLPTEAEWEHAARSGGEHSGDVPGAGALSEHAWYVKNSEQHLRPVAKLSPNAWQLFDLCGNVWEWCHDEWRRDAYRGRVKEGVRIVAEPAHYQEQCTPRVVRGGAFYDSSDRCRLAARPGQEANNGYGVGLRVCLPLL